MPQLDIERAHDDVAMRLRGPHQISYVLVGKEEAVGLRIPQLLRSPCIRITAGLPKSGLQVLNSQWYQHYHRARNLPQPVRFVVVFDKNFPASSVQMVEESALLHIVYWATDDSTALRALASLTSRLAIVPLGSSLKKLLLQAGVDAHSIVETPDAIYDRIEQEVRSHLHTGSVREFEDRIAWNRQIAEEWRNKILPGAQRAFNPLDVNRNQLRQLLGEFRSDFWRFEREDELTGRASAQADTFRSVAVTLIAIADTDDNNSPLRPPSAILAFPSVSPFLKRQLESRIKNVDNRFRSSLKQLIALRLEEQDSSAFNFTIPVKDEELTKKALQIIVPDLASYTRFFDDVGSLHASFNVSPYMRAALKGKSLAQHHSFFAPGTFPFAAKPRAVFRKITTFSEALTAAMDQTMHRALATYPGGVVSLSDLPVEWLVDRGVPLCFSHDVCRIPETVSTNMLSHFNLNNHLSFQVDATTPAKTLIVCGAPSGDPIEKRFASLTSLWRANASPWQWEHCHSLSQLYGIVNDFRPQLLIFDTHGRFTDNNSGSELQIGAEFLNGNDVLKHLPEIPLVMLSTCWGAPLYGCPNTIAHAFFENGTFAVTSSMLPISADKGAILYSRVLGNLRVACETPLHDHWSSFMSHNVRTSYFDDLIEQLFRNGIRELFDSKSFRTHRAHWQTRSMIHKTRRQAFLKAPKTVSKCFYKGTSTKAQSILRKRDYIPEFMYYSTMGRADLVQFAAWNTKHYLPRDPQPKLSDFKFDDNTPREIVSPPARDAL